MEISYFLFGFRVREYSILPIAISESRTSLTIAATYFLLNLPEFWLSAYLIRPT